MNLLSTGNPKTMKGEKSGYLTGVLHLLPWKYAGLGNVCPDATEGCRTVCLVFAGRGQMPKIQQQRKAKNQYLREYQNGFMIDLAKDIIALEKKARREGLTPVVRLNGTSDLPWENMICNKSWANMSLMEYFPTVQFYDYTKSASRMKAFLSGKFPANYSLTFSRSETNEADCQEILKMGGRVAVVFQDIHDIKDGESVTLDGWDKAWPAVSGEDNDLRFNDAGGIIALRAKGRARKDRSGFVVEGATWHNNLQLLGGSN